MISAMILVIPGIEKKRILLLKIWMCAYGNSVLWSKIIHNICSIYIRVAILKKLLINNLR